MWNNLGFISSDKEAKSVLMLINVSIINATMPIKMIDFIKFFDRFATAVKKNIAQPKASREIILSWYA